MGTIRRVAKLSGGFTKPEEEVVVDDLEDVANRRSSLEAALLTERFLSCISAAVVADPLANDEVSVGGGGWCCCGWRLDCSIEGEVDLAFCSVI